MWCCLHMKYIVIKNAVGKNSDLRVKRPDTKLFGIKREQTDYSPILEDGNIYHEFSQVPHLFIGGSRHWGKHSHVFPPRGWALSSFIFKLSVVVEVVMWMVKMTKTTMN